MGFPILVRWHLYIESGTSPRFQALAQSKLRLCSANHRAGYFSNLACDWLCIVWAYSEQETENRPSMGHHVDDKQGSHHGLSLSHQYIIVLHMWYFKVEWQWPFIIVIACICTTIVHSLWPSRAKSSWSSWSTLVEATACCLTLTQYWPIVDKLLNLTALPWKQRWKARFLGWVCVWPLRHVCHPHWRWSAPWCVQRTASDTPSPSEDPGRGKRTFNFTH